MSAVASLPTTAPAGHPNTFHDASRWLRVVTAWNSASPVEWARSDCVDDVMSRAVADDHGGTRRRRHPCVSRRVVRITKAWCCRWQLLVFEAPDKPQVLSKMPANERSTLSIPSTLTSIRSP